MTAVANNDTPRLPTLQAGGSVKAIVPQDFDGAWRIATAVTKAGMAPTGLDTPEKAMVAIMHGMEVGLTPMAALQSIAVVNGRPTIWGDGAIGLVRGSGKCEWIKERIDGEGDAMVAVCEVKRKGEADAIKATFSVADAKKAALWGKAGPWQQYPKRMLVMRARAFALRDGFADVLRGLGIAEEVQDTPAQIRDITPPPPPRPPAPPSITHEPEEVSQAIEHEAEEAVVENEPVADEEIDDTAYFSQLEDALAVVGDLESLEEVWTEFDPLARFDGQPNGEVNQGIAMAIRKRAEKRIGGAA
ncbi:hypothetical protein U8C35_07595 [Sinorhizobium medicae]|uniref:hypothetical protein n=1 Tax=Sinorhizobium medicae TaxID=110321 RepID=UPI002AF6A3B2|nr:hypothetical protein [Sinorhizobium medicae]WQO60274.1 hypothetical protein U8C35_07595 [Sinorhizobium medicae]